MIASPRPRSPVSRRRHLFFDASPHRAHRAAAGNALRLPLLYALSTFVMVLLVMLKSKLTKELPPYVMVASAVGAAVAAALVVHFVLVPRVAANLPSAAGTAAAAAEPTGAWCLLRFLAGGGTDGANTTIERGGGTPAIELTDLGKAAAPPPTPAADVATAQSDEEADATAFRNLLVFVAFLESFAHGANDTANGRPPSRRCTMRTSTASPRAPRARLHGGSCRWRGCASPSAST